MVQRRQSKTLHTILLILGGLLLLLAFGLLTGWLDSALSRLLAAIFHRPPKPGWPGYFHQGGVILLATGIVLLCSKQLVHGSHFLLERGIAWIRVIDAWTERKTRGILDPSEAGISEWPLLFNRWDALAIVFFLLIAFVYQLAVLSPGFPTVILGGDAANIASFAAGRAFPELFKNDAILGNLNNIGLYVTIHLPLAIWLEKLVGNFGLAYSLFLFPHVFLQYFSYYLLARVLYHSSYWAFLLSLATSAPLALDGGELWGIMSDAMPRFTFQVLIPFILILVLSIWREKPARWYWVMVIAGLMAFIHPVSTPAWAFALWLGFWVMFPREWEMPRKIREMIKLGGVLALALLPYASVYLTYHQSGTSKGNYDLVHYILMEFFPHNILNIPGALNTLFHQTARFGLLWYGLAGLLITLLLFRRERPRLKQMLLWMTGIAFVSIFVPWAEITIESAFRLIPLQTELMRSMRYLVPFLFLFWFYPFAEITRRSLQQGVTVTVFAIGTLLTLSWLLLNPPEPFTRASSVWNCWASGEFLCPGNTDQAEALRYIRQNTPEGSKFAVFLTNRWSGIEVRYLGLRPMVYAFKDRGQLLFTNLTALEQWYSYEKREEVIFSPKKSPTLDEKRTGIVEFAREARADYILTDFPFPTNVQQQLGVHAVYQNSTYSVLRSYPGSP